MWCTVCVFTVTNAMDETFDIIFLIILLYQDYKRGHTIDFWKLGLREYILLTLTNLEIIPLIGLGLVLL